MPTAAGCAERRGPRLWRALPGECDALVVADPHHLAYLAGFAPPPYTFRTAGSSAILVLTPDRSTLVGDNLLVPFLERAHVDEVVAPVWYDGTTSPPARRDFVRAAAAEVLGRRRVRRLGFEPATAPMGLVETLGSSAAVEFVAITATLLEARRRKDPDEVDLLRRSIRAGEAGILAALAEVRPGLTELDAYRIIERAAQDDAGERAFLYGDFVSGPGAARRLGPPTGRVLGPGDLFLMDFSVVLDGYRGDLAHTLRVGDGPPLASIRDRGEGCYAALAAGEGHLRPGVPCREVDAAVRATFAARGLDADRAGHNGHGIGLDHPEAPFFVRESRDTLVVGDVVTLEPGQYGDDFGAIRFEPNYLITADGFEPLSPRLHRLPPF